MKFTDIVEQDIQQQQKDPVDTDPNIIRMAADIQRLEQQLAQKKAMLNQQRARVAQKLAQSQKQKSMTMDNNVNKNNLG